MSQGTLNAARTASWWWGFALYAAVSAVHTLLLFVPGNVWQQPTKLMLMPALALAVCWMVRARVVGGLRGLARSQRISVGLLLVAITLSWLGDGAGTFFPTLPTVPLMLGFFGAAHLVYIWLFWKRVGRGGLRVWTALYVFWMLSIVGTLVPAAGDLAIPVVLYGVVLVATAALSSRVNLISAWGGFFFLSSDSILAFRLFTPDVMPDWTSPMVMLTYTLGQGLIALGLLRRIT